MTPITLTLPIYWVDEKKTKPSSTHLIGMNFYRNAFYHTKNKMKKDIEELAINQLPSDITFTQFTVDYSLFYKNPSSDGSNVVALIEKFLLDALQANNTVTNDNVKYHLGSTWSIGGQDKTNPRIEITIKEHE